MTNYKNNSYSIGDLDKAIHFCRETYVEARKRGDSIDALYAEKMQKMLKDLREQIIKEKENEKER